MIAVVLLKPGEVVDAVLRTWLMVRHNITAVVAVDDTAGQAQIVEICKTTQARVLVTSSYMDAGIDFGQVRAALTSKAEIVFTRRDAWGALHGAYLDE
jgi:hypothetical protein